MRKSLAAGATGPAQLGRDILIEIRGPELAEAQRGSHGRANMSFRVFVCESCSSKVGIEEKSKERPSVCPKCRGMLMSGGTSEEFKGSVVVCPDCGNSFLYGEAPFKCAFCDHTFRDQFTYF